MTGIPIIPVSDDYATTVYQRIAIQFDLWNGDIREYRPVWNWRTRLCGARESR